MRTQRYYNLKKVGKKRLEIKEEKMESDEETVARVLDLIQGELNEEHGDDVSRWFFLLLKAFSSLHRVGL